MVGFALLPSASRGRAGPHSLHGLFYWCAMTDLGSTDLADNAEAPRRAVIDGNAVEMHSILNQLEIAYFIAAQAAVADDKRGFAIQRFKASGSQ